MRVLAPLIVLLALVGVLVLGTGLVVDRVTSSEARRISAQTEAVTAEGRARAAVIEAEGRAREAERLAEAAKIEADGRAQAAIIDAQARARLDAATAKAIIAAANLPYFSLTMGFVFGVVILSIFGAVLLIYLIRQPTRPRHPIERQVIFLLPDGYQPGQVWTRSRQLPAEVQHKWLP